MKKYYLLTLLFVSLLFASCQKEEGHYSTCRLKVNVYLSDVLAHLEELNEGDFQLDSYYKIRVQSFLYDSQFKLVDVQDDYLSQYDYMTTLKFDNLDLDEYTIITTSDVVEKNNKRSLFWDFKGTKELNTFTVIDLDKMDVMGERMLTLTESHASIRGRRATQSISVDVEPVTAMVCATFHNIFHWDENFFPGDYERRIYDYLDITIPERNNTITYVEDTRSYPWEFSCTGNTAAYYGIASLTPTDDMKTKGLTDIYGYHAVLAGQYDFIGYGDYHHELHHEQTGYTSTPSTGRCILEAGRQYYLDFYIDSFRLEYEPSNTRSASVNGYPVRSLREYAAASDSTKVNIVRSTIR